MHISCDIVLYDILLMSQKPMNPYQAGFFMYYTPPQFYPTDFQDSSYQHVFTNRVENSVDPDQLASQKPADLDRHCLQIGDIYPGLAW